MTIPYRQTTERTEHRAAVRQRFIGLTPSIEQVSAVYGWPTLTVGDPMLTPEVEVDELEFPLCTKARAAPVPAAIARTAIHFVLLCPVDAAPELEIATSGDCSRKLLAAREWRRGTFVSAESSSASLSLPVSLLFTTDTADRLPGTAGGL